MRTATDGLKAFLASGAPFWAADLFTFTLVEPTSSSGTDGMQPLGWYPLITPADASGTLAPISQAYGCNASGYLIVGASHSYSTGDRYAVIMTTVSGGLWPAGVWQPIPLATGDTSGENNTATAINAGGTVVVGQNNGNAWIWTVGASAATGIPILPALSADLDQGTTAAGVSDDGGTVALTCVSVSAGWACIWTAAGGTVQLAPPAGTTNTTAIAISGDGSTVVGWLNDATDPGQASFVWTAAGGMVNIGYPTGAGGSAVTGVSHDGSIVCGYDDSSAPFTWTAAGGFVMQDVPAGWGGFIYSGYYIISSDGSTVTGTMLSPSSEWRVVQWSHNGPLIDVGPITLTEVFMDGPVTYSLWPVASNADGTIIVGGNAMSEDGGEAFRMDTTSGSGTTGSVVPYYLTSADRPISFGGTTWLPAATDRVGLTRSSWAVKNTIEVPKMEIDLISGGGENFLGSLFPVLAMHNGLLDTATVLMQRAIMPLTTGPDDTALGLIDIFAGPIGEIALTGTGAKIKVRGANSKMAQYMPRNRFLSPCIHGLYDAGCGLNRALFTFSGVVSAASAANINWVSDPTSGAFARLFKGYVSMTSGAATGQKRTIANATSGGILLAYPLYQLPVPGDTFTVTFGCLKTIDYCSAAFNNYQNYRGFPFVPGEQSAVII